MKPAFTLIELLVVVTIIVVLLAMLTPALDRAIMQTELATCAARERGLVVIFSQWALEHQRKWPSGLRNPPNHTLEHAIWVGDEFIEMVAKAAGRRSRLAHPNPADKTSGTQYWGVVPEMVIDPAFKDFGWHQPNVGWLIGYNYLGGHPALSPANKPQNGYPQWESPIRMSKPSNPELIACLQTWSPGIATNPLVRVYAISAHIEGGGPLGSAALSPPYFYQGSGTGGDVESLGAMGANVGNTDGSVAWHPLGNLQVHESGATDGGSPVGYPAYW